MLKGTCSGWAWYFLWTGPSTLLNTPLFQSRPKKTFQHLQRAPSRFGNWLLQVSEDGRLLNISQAHSSAELPIVWASDDDGETWEQLCQIDVAPLRNIGVESMTRLNDGTLLVPIHSSNTEYVFRSRDGGRTFPYRSILGDWCCEVNIADLPSDRLLAVIRYQRSSLPDDPSDLLERTGAAAFGSNFPYKHVFLADSADGGVTWTNLRQLTTVFGQCHGAAVGLRNDRVVVVHDHRYPRELASGRALVSRDGGQTWEDEVYYLCHGNAAGYARTITLDGEEMLTLVGSAYGDVEAWENCIGKSHFVLVRWRLV